VTLTILIVRANALHEKQNTTYGLQNKRAAVRSTTPSADNSSACFLIKFISIGSSTACAARSNMSSSRSTTLAKESLLLLFVPAKMLLAKFLHAVCLCRFLSRAEKSELAEDHDNSNHVPEDAAHGGQHVDPRPSQRFERY
jgi:hypothetical protein